MFWLGCLPTWHTSFNRYSTHLLVWSIVWEFVITSLMYSSVFIGCEFQSEYSICWLFWYIKFYMEAHLATLASSFASLICLVDEHSVLLDQIVYCCHHLSCQLPTIELSRSPLRIFGTSYLTMSRRPDHCQPSGSNWSWLCFSSHSQTLFCDV